MPIYEYRCVKCHNEFEVLLDADESPSCPQCQDSALERLWSVPSRPQSSMPLKTACQADPSTPPCGPMCSRFRQ
jgi:putative FmdB family regulatory protein